MFGINRLALVISSLAVLPACNLLTENATPISIQIDLPVPWVEPGGSLQITPLVSYTGGGSVTALPIEWETSNAAVASVSESGLVTGHQPGSAVITARLDKLYASVTVQVGEFRAYDIELIEELRQATGTKMNASGEIVGNLDSSLTDARPFYWGEAGVVDLAIELGIDAGRATGINAQGMVTVATQGDSPCPDGHQSFLWSRAIEEPVTLCGQAADINNLGQLALNGTPSRAAVWQDGVEDPLAVPPDIETIEVMAINGSGQVLAEITWADCPAVGAGLFDADGTVARRYCDLEPIDLNDDGDFVGYSPGSGSGVVVLAGEVEDLPGSPVAIDNQGAVILSVEGEGWYLHEAGELRRIVVPTAAPLPAQLFDLTESGMILGRTNDGTVAILTPR